MLACRVFVCVWMRARRRHVVGRRTHDAQTDAAATDGWAGGLESSVKGLLSWFAPPAAGPSEAPGASDAAGQPELEHLRPEHEPEAALPRENVSALQDSDLDQGPLLLLLPEASSGACEALMVEVCAALRGCMRGVCVSGAREDAEHVVSRGMAEVGTVSDIVVFSVRNGVAKTCCYRSDPASFESLSYFCASILHSNYLFGGGAFLRPTGFVRYVCAHSMQELLGSGAKNGASNLHGACSTLDGELGACRAHDAWQRDSAPPCAILATRSNTAPEWFVSASRLFAPRIRFGLAAEPVVRRAMGIQDRQLDPRSPSNPSNESYILLFLPGPGGDKRQEGVVQYRGEGSLRPVAAFLAASLLARKPTKAPDGSWVGLIFGRAPAADLRDKLRLMAVSAWYPARAPQAIAAEQQRRRALDLCQSLCTPSEADAGDAPSRTVQGGQEEGLAAAEAVDAQLLPTPAPKGAHDSAVGADGQRGHVSHSTGLGDGRVVDAKARAVYDAGLVEEVRSILWARALAEGAELPVQDYRRHLARLPPLLQARHRRARESALQAQRPRHGGTQCEVAHADTASGWVKIDTPTTCVSLTTPTMHAEEALDMQWECVDKSHAADDGSVPAHDHAAAASSQDVPACSSQASIARGDDAHAGDATAASHGATRCPGVGQVPELPPTHVPPEQTDRAKHTEGEQDKMERGGNVVPRRHVYSEALSKLQGMGFCDTELNMRLLQAQLRERGQLRKKEIANVVEQVLALKASEATGGGSEVQQAQSGAAHPPARALEDGRVNSGPEHAGPEHAGPPSLPSRRQEDAPEKAAEEADATVKEERRSGGTDEEQLQQICLDLERTFPGMSMFQVDGCLYGELRALLFAVACERPALGYVQGMSHLAALLLLYMSPLPAYRCLVRLLDAAPHLEPFFLVDMPAISRYSDAFDAQLACHRPLIATR